MHKRTAQCMAVKQAGNNGRFSLVMVSCGATEDLTNLEWGIKLRTYKPHKPDTPLKLDKAPGMADVIDMRDSQPIDPL